MNQLTKLIIEYEKETGYRSMNWEGGFSIQFVEFLASRPTCGEEQRKFLDEVEKSGILGSVGGIIIKSKSDYKDPIVIEQSEFKSDLSKVIKGD